MSLDHDDDESMEDSQLSNGDIGGNEDIDDGENDGTNASSSSNFKGEKSSSSSQQGKLQSQQYLAVWDFDAKKLDKWIRTVPALFPGSAASAAVTAAAAAAATSSSKSSGGSKKSKSSLSSSPSAAVTASAKAAAKAATEAAAKKGLTTELSNQAWKNLSTALNSLQVQVEDLPDEEQDDHDEENDNDPHHYNNQGRATDWSRIESESGKLDTAHDGGDSRNNLKRKNNNHKKKKKKQKWTIVDPYNLYVHTIRKPEEDEDDPLQEDPYEEAAKELKTTIGGKLTQLSLSGLINGLAGHMGGLVQNKLLEASSGVTSLQNISTAANTSLSVLKPVAASLQLAVQTKVEADVLVTTPIRIQEMLAPDLSTHEFKSIRQRINTTIRGKMNNRNMEGSDIPTAASTGVHDIEKFKKCKSCGNNDQSLFVLDRKNGDVICSNCGTVASESLMHEGSQFRKFEGEADRNHHGDAANPLYSNAHNMSTTLGGVQMTTGAGVGGFGSQKRGLETVLRNAHAYTELNISQFGKGDRRTRIGYKDKQKKDAFLQMAHCGDALNLHEAVVQRAKELFAGFRDDRELVQQFKGVIAACLCEAFDQLSSDGRQIIKQRQEAVTELTYSNPRANRRNELHHANLAGRGGLLLDFEAIRKNQSQAGAVGSTDTAPAAAGGGNTAAQQQQQQQQQASAGASQDQSSSGGVASKIVSSWDLDDCRSWLLEASRSIAQRWVEDRKKDDGGLKDIPNGSVEELEGKMVEHAITLCNHLEQELKDQIANNNNNKKVSSSRRVVTPRVQNMAKLGIRWQHAHERGSGGAGGVGNNSQTKKNNQPSTVLGGAGRVGGGGGGIRNSSASARLTGKGGTSSSSSSGGGGRTLKTAGQMLIMKTAKKLAMILNNDVVCGSAIHKELRSLVGRQEAEKRKRLREEATRQRFAQMKRKPWLQLRAERV